MKSPVPTAFRFLFRRWILPAAAWIFAASAPTLSAGPVPSGKPASYPAWWFERDVIPRTDPGNAAPAWPADYPAVDNFAMVNQGQFKNIAARAAAELNASLAQWGGAGTSIDDLLLPWSEPGGDRDDYVAVNQAQVKTIAKLFYARLIAVGYVNANPWSEDDNDDDNYAVVNIGQVKHLFRFDLRADTDTDGLPDWWEQLIIDADPGDALVGLADILPGDNFDHDDFTNEEEFEAGTGPVLPNGADSDVDGLVDTTEPYRGARVGLKDHPAVRLQFNLAN